MGIADRLEFRLLGPVEVWRGPERLAVSSRHQRCVLAALARTGWQTYGAYINFNPGGCEAFTIVGGSFGDTYTGYIDTPTQYSTGR